MVKSKKSLTPECVVPRSIGILLRISQAYGVAPARLAAKPDGYVVRFSPSACLYGYAITTTFALISTLALGFDWSVSLGESTRMSSEIKRGVWVIDVAVVTMLAVVGGYQAPAHMRTLIDIVNRVQKIISELKVPTKCLKSSEDRLCRYVVIALAMLFAIMIVDSFYFMYIAMTKGQRVWIAAMYSCHYCNYIISRLLYIQFILTAYYVLSALKHINSRLWTLQKKYDQSNSYKRSSQHDQAKLNSTNLSDSWPWPTAYTISIQPRSLNKIIDNLTNLNNRRKDHVTSGGTDAQTIRHLSLSYGAVCDIIKELNKSYGTVLLLLLVMFLLHLIVTLYYIITYIILYDDIANLFFEKVTTPIVQAMWCGYHISNLIIMVEPCHRMHEEIERTKELISQFMSTLTLQMNDPLQVELELFCRRLMLKQASYSPHQVCTLTRSLIATILGSITTYLAVIIQI